MCNAGYQATFSPLHGLGMRLDTGFNLYCFSCLQPFPLHLKTSTRLLEGWTGGGCVTVCMSQMQRGRKYNRKIFLMKIGRGHWWNGGY